MFSCLTDIILGIKILTLFSFLGEYAMSGL